MSDRHQIMDDRQFWNQLEYVACAWLQSSDMPLRRFWIDGFVPETVSDTKHGADVKGTAWVGEGPRKQSSFCFTVSLPQKMLHRRRKTFFIKQLSLDDTQKTLHVEVVSEQQVA